MADPTNTTTAIALPERVPALLRIYEDLLGKFAVMVRNTFEDQRKRGQRIPSLKECRELIEDHVIWDPKNPGVPQVGRVAFEPEKVQVTYTVTQKTDREGNPVFDKDSNPVPWFEKVMSNSIVARMVLSGSGAKPHPPKSTVVRPVFTFNGMGNPMGYAYIDEQGALRMVPPMLSIFVACFDIWSGEETGGIWMIPLGIAELSLLDHYKSIVSRLAVQGSTRKWEVIEPLTHALGYPGSYIDLPPLGIAANKGLMPSWRDFNEADPQKPDGWIVYVAYGKMVKLDERSQPIIIRAGKIPVQRCSFRECLTVARVKVLGLPEEIGTMEGIGRTLDLGDVRVNVLELFGATLYDVNPRSGVSLIRNAIQNPPIERMIAWGLVPPAATRELAIQTIRGMSALIRFEVERIVSQPITDLVNELKPGSLSHHGLSLADMLGGEPTLELLMRVLERGPTEDDLLMVAILTSETAVHFGLDVFDSKCYVTTQAWRELLLDRAKRDGVELPPPPEANKPAESSVSSTTPPNAASAHAIIWHEKMGRLQLYELAKPLEGITSKATKPALIAALQAVCPPTPPPAP